MSSLKSPATPAGADPSTSTTGTGSSPAGPAAPAPAHAVSNWTLATKLQVRRRSAALTATRSAAAQTLDLADGRVVAIRAGDWILSRGAAIVDWAHGGALDETYDIVQDGALTISPSLCRSIEDLTGIGTTKTAVALLDGVRRLARIRIGQVEIPFTPGQLEELAARATKRGRTVEAEIAAVIARIKDELFWKG